MSSVFAFLALSQLVARACRSHEFFLGNIPGLTYSGQVAYGQLLVGGLPSFNGIFFFRAAELHFAYQEKVWL